MTDWIKLPGREDQIRVYSTGVVGYVQQLTRLQVHAAIWNPEGGFWAYRYAATDEETARDWCDGAGERYGIVEDGPEPLTPEQEGRLCAEAVLSALQNITCFTKALAERLRGVDSEEERT